MKNCKTIFFIFLFTFTITIIYFIYHSIDKGYKYSYLEDSYEWKKKENIIFREILNLKAKEKNNIRYILEKEMGKDNIIEKNNCFLLYESKIQFDDNNILKEVILEK